jgi:hypothetical protein
VQTCIVQLPRHSLLFASWKGRRVGAPSVREQQPCLVLLERGSCRTVLTAGGRRDAVSECLGVRPIAQCSISALW